MNTPDGPATVSKEADGSTTVESPEGKLSVDGDGDKFKMEGTDSEGRSYSIEGGRDFDVAELGIPMYPGSTVANGAEAKSSVTGPMGTMMTVLLDSSDSPEKVIEFYKNELKDPKPFSGPEAGLVTGKSADGADVAVTASKDQKSASTRITVSVTKK